MTNRSRAAGSRSPLTRLPRNRQAGEGLRLRFHEVFTLPVAFAFGWVAGMFGIVSALWAARIAKLSVSLWALTAVLLVGIAITAIFTIRRFREAVRVQKGAAAEVVVGSLLDDLRKDGCEVIHDLVLKGATGETFNADHVVVSEAGVLIVETKYASKPVQGSGRVKLVAGQVLINGVSPDRDPVRQIMAIRDAVRNELEKAGVRTPPMFAALVYPGWWVEEVRDGDVWLMNPKGVAPAVRRLNRKMLSEREVVMVAGLLRAIGSQA